jgi:hypothetical protein
MQVNQGVIVDFYYQGVKKNATIGSLGAISIGGASFVEFDWHREFDHL